MKYSRKVIGDVAFPTYLRCPDYVSGAGIPQLNICADSVPLRINGEYVDFAAPEDKHRLNKFHGGYGHYEPCNLYSVVPNVIEKHMPEYIRRCKIPTSTDECLLPMQCIELEPNPYGAKFVVTDAGIFSASGMLIDFESACPERYYQRPIGYEFKAKKTFPPLRTVAGMLFSRADCGKMVPWPKGIDREIARGVVWNDREFIYDQSAIYDCAMNEVIFAANGEIIWQFISGHVILVRHTDKGAYASPRHVLEISQIIRLAPKKPSKKLPECPICFEHGERVAYSPCGHATVCTKCDGGLRECPICRAAIKSRIVLRQ